MGEPEIIEVTPRHLVGVRRKVPVTELASYFAEVLPRVKAWLGAKGVEATSMPMALWWSMDQQLGIADVQAGCFVASAVQGEGDITAARTPGGRAVFVVHRGSYQQMGQSWMKAYATAAKEDAMPGAGWEIYEDDPTTLPEEQVRTLIYLPLLDTPALSPQRP